MTGALPRFTGPAQARKRLRLVAAIGVLAITGVVAGALASLGERGPTPDTAARRAQPRATGAETPERRDLAALVEIRVVEAEDAVDRAWAAVRSARQLGLGDPQLLDEFERRLEGLGGGGPSAASPVEPRSPQPPPSSKAPRLSIDGSPRGL